MAALDRFHCSGNTIPCLLASAYPNNRADFPLVFPCYNGIVTLWFSIIPPLPSVYIVGVG